LALDVPFAREVAEDSATYFNKDAEDLRKKIKELEIFPPKVNEKAYEIYRKKYSHDRTISAFDEFINNVVIRNE
jgi:hypothetical protein